MPRATKGSQRELSLTSSFVAGGFAYHVDPSPHDTATGKIGGKPLLFYRFEDTKRSSLTGVGVYSLKAIMSSSAGESIISTVPEFSSMTPHLFANNFDGSPLTTALSEQVRSIRFGQDTGIFDTVDVGTIRVDNASPTTSVDNSEEGDGHVVIKNSSALQEIVDYVYSTGGLTICAWIHPERMEIQGSNYATPPPSLRLVKHVRPIFTLASTANSAIVERALISFQVVNDIFDKDVGQYISDTEENAAKGQGIHRSLRLVYRNNVTSTNPFEVYSSGRVILENKWQHVAVVLEAGSASVTKSAGFRFYVNGRLVGVNNRLLQTETNTYPRTLSGAVDKTKLLVRIGGRASGLDGGYIYDVGGVSKAIGSFFIGNIDDVALWNRSLTGDEIAAIYSAHRAAYDPQSGYLNNPPRSVIRERDNTAGQYPTSNFSPDSNMTSTAFKEGD